MSDPMPQEIWAWRAIPPTWHVERPGWVDGPHEPARYLRADLLQAEAKALADRLDKYEIWNDSGEYLVGPIMMETLSDFLNRLAGKDA